MNLFDSELQLIFTKTIIKNKVKELFSKLKKFKVQTILFLEYQKRNNRRIFHSNAKLIASDSDIDEAFKSKHQSIMSTIKNYAGEDWIVLDMIIKHSIKIFECAQINGDNKYFIAILYRINFYFKIKAIIVRLIHVLVILRLCLDKIRLFFISIYLCYFFIFIRPFSFYTFLVFLIE